MRPSVSLTLGLVGILGAALGCTEEPPRHHRVAIAGLRFLPERLVVAAGDTVTWRNEDIVPHTVTGPAGLEADDVIDPDGELMLVAERGDSANYLCRYHPGMTGTLVVR